MILILDDHPVARQGLCSLIQLHYSTEEIIQADTVKQAKELVVQHQITMVFVDLHLNGESGFDFVAWAANRDAPIKIFIITSCSRLEDFHTARQMGVSAYVLKDAFLDEILYALKIVDQGGRFYSPALIERLSDSTDQTRTLDCLTEREQEVFRLLCQGLSNTKISQALFISEGTTKKHVTSILSKLSLKNRVDVVLLAAKLERRRADGYAYSGGTMG